MLLSIFILSCNKCEDIDCFTPPLPIYFELIDSQTGENLIENGTFRENDILLINTSNNDEKQAFSTDSNKIEVAFWNGGGTIAFLLKGEPRFNFSIRAESKTNGCCSFTEYSNQSLTNADYEEDESTDTYRVKID